MVFDAGVDPAFGGRQLLRPCRRVITQQAAAGGPGTCVVTVASGHRGLRVRADGGLLGLGHVGGDIDRKSVGAGKSVSVRVDLGGSRIIKKKNNKKKKKYWK